jgi:hypothetical protein
VSRCAVAVVIVVGPHMRHKHSLDGLGTDWHAADGFAGVYATLMLPFHRDKKEHGFFLFLFLFLFLFFFVLSLRILESIRCPFWW